MSVVLELEEIDYTSLNNTSSFDSINETVSIDGTLWDKGHSYFYNIGDEIVVDIDINAQDGITGISIGGYNKIIEIKESHIGIIQTISVPVTHTNVSGYILVKFSVIRRN